MSTVVWLLEHLWALVIMLLLLAVILGFATTTYRSFVLPFRFLRGGFRYRKKKKELNTELNRIYKDSDFDTSNDLKEREKYLKSQLDQLKTSDKIRTVIGRQSVLSMLFSLSLTLPFLTTCEMQSTKMVAIDVENSEKQITGNIEYSNFNIFNGRTEYEFSKKASKDSVKIVKGVLLSSSAISTMLSGAMNLMSSTRILNYKMFSSARDLDDGVLLAGANMPFIMNEFESDKLFNRSVRDLKRKDQLENDFGKDLFSAMSDGMEPVVLRNSQSREFAIYFLLFITYGAFALYVEKIYNFKDFLSFKNGESNPSEKSFGYASYVMLLSYVLLLLIMIFTSTFQLLRVGAFVMLIITLLIFSSDPFRPKLFILKKGTWDEN